MPNKRNGKRILSVMVTHHVDTDPDTSWLGEYSQKQTSEYSIDRGHTLDCASVQPTNKEAIDKLERIIFYIDNDTEEGISATDQLVELQEQITECDCRRQGKPPHHEFRYFNPSFNYVDAQGKALPENTPEEIRKYVAEDYARMESFNSGNWRFLGITAEARVQVGSDVVQKITSGGLWGIESDCGAKEIEAEEQNQLADLKTKLRALGFSTRAIHKAYQTVEKVND